MKRILVSALALSACGLLAFAPTSGTTAPAAPAAYTVDGVHSFVTFRCKHLNTSFAYGRFDKIAGTIGFDDAKPEANSLNIEVMTDSVSTTNVNRDKHLKSDAFFDASQFPKATFVSKSFAKSGENTFDVKGDFTLRGVTKEITIKLEKTGQGKGQGGKEIIGFESTFTINRMDYGVKFMPDMLGQDVRITVALESGKN
jgi:polyisoprenoid-binding protein YceI